LVSHFPLEVDDEVVRVDFALLDAWLALAVESAFLLLQE